MRLGTNGKISSSFPRSALAKAHHPYDCCNACLHINLKGNSAFSPKKSKFKQIDALDLPVKLVKLLLYIPLSDLALSSKIFLYKLNMSEFPPLKTCQPENAQIISKTFIFKGKVLQRALNTEVYLYVNYGLIFVFNFYFCFP